RPPIKYVSVRGIDEERNFVTRSQGKTLLDHSVYQIILGLREDLSLRTGRLKYRYPDPQPTLPDRDMFGTNPVDRRLSVLRLQRAHRQDRATVGHELLGSILLGDSALDEVHGGRADESGDEYICRIVI